jgi:hypothetical protein
VPSPIGHALGGVAAGWLVARPMASRAALTTQTAILAAVAAAPDLDLLWHRHSAETHSVGAALIVAGVAAAWAWPVASTRWRIFLAVFAAYATHPLLDALYLDVSPPIGVMAFWPFSHAYVQTGWSVFGGIERRTGMPDFWTHNLASVAREVVILGPVATMTYWLRRPPGRLRPASRTEDGRAGMAPANHK